MAGRAQVWTALLQRRYSHQNLFGLLRCPHEPYSVCSQLRRPAGPSRTRAQTRQHLTENQGQQWHQHSSVLEMRCANRNICRSGWVSMSAHISDPFSGWYWAADVAGFDEWSDGGDWRPARTGVAAERLRVRTVSAFQMKYPLLHFYQYLQVHEKNAIKTTIHHTLTCSCSLMRVEILPKIQAPLILSFTRLSSPLFLIWPKRLMTFVSWRHPASDERSGQPYFQTHNKESPCHQWCHFCLLQDLDQEPEVKQLTSDPVEIKADHFSQPSCGSDSSHGAPNLPIPEVRYLIKEISVVWHLYGGKDFRSAASPSRSRGWANSCSDVHTRNFIYYYYNHIHNS